LNCFPRHADVDPSVDHEEGMILSDDDAGARLCEYSAEVELASVTEVWQVSCRLWPLLSAADVPDLCVNRTNTGE